MLNKIKQFFAPLKIGRLDVGMLYKISFPLAYYDFRADTKWLIRRENGRFINGKWQIKKIKVGNISSMDRGHSVFWDGDFQIWRYLDNGKPVNNIRPCSHCGESPTVEGYDSCIGYIPGAKYACCGHGIKEYAYIIK